ncbi:hypothetical protein BKA69DRAFT_1124838 [Paraphysoderma sedebokerense]|nr:hypothetical protein BKA69DRAFT_1124838 [Paraphysoderma sedebokerense]
MSVEEQLSILTTTLSDLYADSLVAPYYLTYFKKKAADEHFVTDEEGVARVFHHIKALGLEKSARFFHVESDYYDWPLQKRAFRLRAPSQAHLCKSIIFENTRCTNDNSDGIPYYNYQHMFSPTLNLNAINVDPSNSKYYCVITQYVAKLNTEKLLKFVRRLKNNEISKKNYNFRVTAAETSLRITGYDNNAVSPFGMLTDIPIIITESIAKLKPGIFFLGAGHVDWKVGLPVKEFIQVTGCYIADLE